MLYVLTSTHLKHFIHPAADVLQCCMFLFNVFFPISWRDADLILSSHEDFYTDGQDLHHEAHHSHHKRLHVFAPPVFIQADADASEMYSTYDEQLLDDEDDASSQASSTTRRKSKSMLCSSCVWKGK